MRCPWYETTMDRQASPHSAASSCMTTGRRPWIPKFTRLCITSGSALYSGTQERIEQPIHQRASFEDDVGPEPHVGLERALPAVGVDVRPVERDRHLVGGFLQRDLGGDVGTGQDGLRDLGDPA